MPGAYLFLFFFFNDTATTEIYTLSLHDALPISLRGEPVQRRAGGRLQPRGRDREGRSEEHTSELQSLAYLVCRLLLEKKKNKRFRPLCISRTGAECGRRSRQKSTFMMDMLSIPS